MEQTIGVRVVLILVALSAMAFLATVLGNFIGFFADTILILFIAWIVASNLRHFAEWIGRRIRVPYMLGAVLAYVIFLLPLLTVIAFLIPVTIRQVIQFSELVPDLIERWPEYLENAELWLLGFGVQVDLLQLAQSDTLIEAGNSTASTLGRSAVTVAQAIGTFIFQGTLTLVLTFYMLIDYDRLSTLVFRFIPSRFRPVAHAIFTQMDQTFHSYIQGIAVISLVYAMGTTFVMAVQGLPLALPIGLIAGLFITVPFIGDIIAISIPVVLSLFSGSASTILFVLISLIALQQVMSNIVSPRLLESAVKMPALLVILAVIIGAKLAGLWGALLGVPVMAAAYSFAIACLDQGSFMRVQIETSDEHAPDDAEQKNLVEERSAEDQMSVKNEDPVKEELPATGSVSGPVFANED